MKCPACGKATNVYKCNNCGEVRCGYPSCSGTSGGKKGSANTSRYCHSCRKGKYTKIS